MYPRNRVDALLSTLENEAAIRDLTMAAYETWLPAVNTAVFPSLTAASDELPPDPAALVRTQTVWESALDGLIVYGAGLVYGRELLSTYSALGGDAVDDDPDQDEDDDTLPRKARRIVAKATGVSVSAVRAIDRRINGNPALKALRETFMREVRARRTDVPAAVAADLTKQLDAARLSNVAPSEIRVQIQTWLKPGADNWGQRARETARTESAGSQSLATIEAAKIRNAEIGEQLEQTWICTLDSRTRKSHWAADGQRVPLGGRFKIGKTELRGPGDHLGPDEETRNCRCRVGILAVDEKLPGEDDRHTERGKGDSTVKNRNGTQEDEIAAREAEGNIRAREDPDGIGRVASAHDERFDMTAPIDEETTEDSATMFRTFTDQVIAVIGSPTDDRRILASDISLGFRDFPLPLMWVEQSSGGHYNSYTVGVIEDARVEGTNVVASGYMLNSDEANEAAEQSAHGVSNPSVDLGDTEWMLTDENGAEITEEQWWDADGDLKIFETVTSAKLLGATLVAIPAFGETRFKLDAERQSRDIGLVASLTAGSRYVEPKYNPEWFANPHFTEPTDVTVTEDGRIFGHLACFGECHVGIGKACVMAPRSTTNYAHFLTSPPVLLEDGTRQKVGRLTVGGGHADGTLGARPAAEHYDNVGSCFALVNVGEDAHGVWFAGTVHPTATQKQITDGISAPLSGDWRMIGGNYELVAALSVNNPGFPILAGANDAEDNPMSLVASLGPRREADDKPLTRKDVAALGEQIVASMHRAEKRRTEAAAIVASVTGKRRDEAKKIIVASAARDIIKSVGGK